MAVGRRRPRWLYAGVAPGCNVTPGCLLVLSEPDPVASRVAEIWGAPPSTGEHVDGAPIRQLGPDLWTLRRPGPHIHDEHLDARLPRSGPLAELTLIFPSIHRSEQNVPCLTVHPLGNPGPIAEVGGRPRTLVPTDPRRMAAVLRALSERAGGSGLDVTYEATHHGPELGRPAFFAEIGFGESSAPSERSVRVLADALREPVLDPADRVALACGGGHYAPHFTELALVRRWAFGHVLSRHALESIDRATARSAFDLTPGAEGIVFARARDQDHPALSGLAERRRDQEAPFRTTGPATGA